MTQQPVAGAWYVDSNCQFLRVWALVYIQGQIQKVVLSYLNGQQEIIDLDQWCSLDLVSYPQKKQRRRTAASFA